MGWLSYKNYTKDKDNVEKSWINSRWVWFIGNGNKDISLQVTSTPRFGWGLNIEGCDREICIDFWFILKFYITFTGVFPEWIYTKEYNEFADESNKALRKMDSDQSEKIWSNKKNNQKLKGRARTKESGWIRAGKRDLSLRFHNYSMFWNIWRDNDSWSSDISRWRCGNLDFVKLLKGNSSIDNELIFEEYGEIQMPEGKYMCKIDYTKYTRKYNRWWSNIWYRFQFEFGYINDNGDWIKTPIPHWGKGENSWDCGMDGTYSISLGSGVDTLEEAKEKVIESCIRDRNKYGNVDFSKVSGIEDGYVKVNLIGQF